MYELFLSAGPRRTVFQGKPLRTVLILVQPNSVHLGRRLYQLGCTTVQQLYRIIIPGRSVCARRSVAGGPRVSTCVRPLLGVGLCDFLSQLRVVSAVPETTRVPATATSRRVGPTWQACRVSRRCRLRSGSLRVWRSVGVMRAG